VELALNNNMTTYNLNISLEQLIQWADDEKMLTSLKPKVRRHLIESGEIVRYLEGFFPLAVIKRCSRMIIDEGVDVNDIVLKVIDESTGEEHPYNPPLEAVYKDSD
jgi:hypothetical protein